MGRGREGRCIALGAAEAGRCTARFGPGRCIVRKWRRGVWEGEGVGRWTFFCACDGVGCLMNVVKYGIVRRQKNLSCLVV